MKRYSILLFATLIHSACGEEKYVYPDLITEMTCLRTDSKGFGHQIITDEGKIWYLQEGNQPSELTPDSLYRVVSRFAPITDTEAEAYTFYSTTSSLPKAESEYPEIKTAPVSLQSIWRSGDYLNIILQVMVKDQAHELSFIENGITDNADGTQTLTLTLFHDRKNDVEDFDQKFYLSVPLWHYEGKLNKGDPIVFQLNTYKKGMTSHTFIY